jgi:UDP-N-acetyl-D-glucosamine dehydrogenase
MSNSSSPDIRSPETYETLLAQLSARSALIGVVGLGYVGLPLSLTLAEAGVTVLGFDIDPSKAAAIKEGSTYLKQFPKERILGVVNTERLDATSDMSRLGEPDVIIICVPTPLTKNYDPDLSYVVRTSECISEQLRRGQLIILESTTYPGTTKEVVRPILERSGLKCGEDFFLAFSPEREDPGNTSHSTATIPKVVGADDAWSLELSCAVYSTFGAKTVPVFTSATAEAVKITENIFRAVNIALVNELKLVYTKMGINIWDVIDAAKTKPFGFMPFYPGPGLGGHCIPIDPFYLTWKAREFAVSTKFVELAGQINTSMTEYVISVLASALDNRYRKGLNGTRILMLGLAYKKNVDDLRESPSLRLMEMLEERGAGVDYYDELIPVIPATREHRSLTGKHSVRWDLDSIMGYDAVLIATDHDSVDYVSLAEVAKLVVDTRNVCFRTGAKMTNVVLA